MKTIKQLAIEHKCEVWMPIVGYEDLYHVSSIGNVKALCVEKLRGRFKHKQPEKILRLKKHRDSYLIATLSKNNIPKMFQVHRLVGIAFITNPENKPFINHKNGVKWDNRAENLEWCTGFENMIHGVKTGLIPPTKGEINGMSKLKEKDVKTIFLSKKSALELSKQYKVSSAHIYLIKQGKSWSYLTSKL